MDLAKLVPKQEKKKRPDNEAEKFIKHFNVQKGEELVPAYVIYDKYKSWKKGNAMDMKWFFKHFIKIFERVKKEGSSFYKLDPKGFDLREENVWRARRHIRREYEKIYGNKEATKEKSK